MIINTRVGVSTKIVITDIHMKHGLAIIPITHSIIWEKKRIYRGRNVAHNFNWYGKYKIFVKYSIL